MQLGKKLVDQHLGHAYIFNGRDRDGLLEAALELAQTLNCLAESAQQRPCGGCSPCLQLRHGVFGDWFLLEPQGASQTIRIEQVRRLQGDLAGKPVAGRMKVAVFQQADRMNAQSQNCLLKTLEEPPDNSILLLLTDKLEALLPTVRSRCQLLTFEGNQSLPDTADFDLAEDVIRELGILGYEAVFDKAAFVEKSRRKELPGFFFALEILLRDGMLRAWDQDGGNLEALTQAPSGQALQGTPTACLDGLGLVWRAAYLLERNVSPGLILENLFLKLSKLNLRSRN